MNDQSIEREIQEKGLNAPRLNPDFINSKIESEWYFNAGESVVPNGDMPPVPADHPLRVLTICVLVLKNGFTVQGYSSCVSPENFDKEIGQKVAKQNAINEIWKLEGYLLKERLYQQQFLPNTQ